MNSLEKSQKKPKSLKFNNSKPNNTNKKKLSNLMSHLAFQIQTTRWGMLSHNHSMQLRNQRMWRITVLKQKEKARQLLTINILSLHQSVRRDWWFPRTTIIIIQITGAHKESELNMKSRFKVVLHWSKNHQ